MKIATIFQEKKAVFSLEVFPPKKTSSIDTIYRTLESVSILRPDFISVTYGAGGTAQNLTKDIALRIKERYDIEPLPHLSCLHATKAQILDSVRELEDAGLENVLALRGDRNPDLPLPGDFQYASQLTALIRENSRLDIGGACYPEGHLECPSLELDILHLKEKVNAGATHLISQLFFDNNDFYQFLYRAREAGITVPIEAGIMPVTNRRQIQRMVSLCGASLPKKFSRMLAKYGDSDAALQDAGIAYAVDQIVDLLSNNVQGIHLYAMNNPYVARRILTSVANIYAYVNP